MLHGASFGITTTIRGQAASAASKLREDVHVTQMLSHIHIVIDNCSSIFLNVEGVITSSIRAFQQGINIACGYSHVL